MDISIIIPIYNVEPYIEDCLKSVTSQTCLEKGVTCECILVDDCGTDQSKLICERFVSDYKGTILFHILNHEHNRGLSAARNTGMEIAQGEYVYFLDSDDKITPDCLEKLYTKAKETSADVTFGSYETFGCEHKQYITDGSPFVTAWNKLCKKSYLDENDIKFLEGLIHEDCPWSLEIECKQAKFAHVSDITYLYLVREGSLQTGKDFNKHFEAYMQIMRLYAEIITVTRQGEEYIWWFEHQKSVFFEMTKCNGSTMQCRKMYSLIRSLYPKLHYNKVDWHYFFPEYIGYYIYKRSYKYHLCCK